MRRARTSIAVATAGAVLSCASAALAAPDVGTLPPSAADRAGLLRAFRHVHGGRSHVLLVGFRECCRFSNTPGQVIQSAAAYYLVPGSGGSYAGAVVELYRRTGGTSWAHVARFRNKTPLWNDANGLGLGPLWRVSSDGTGTYDDQSTNVADDGSMSSTSKSHVGYTWNLAFKGPSQLIESDSLTAKRSLVGQASAGTTTTYPDSPGSSASCAGTMRDVGNGSSPFVTYAQYPEYGRTKALDFTVQVAGSQDLSWPSDACNSDWATFPDTSRLLVGARMPVAVAIRHGIFEQGGLHGRPRLGARPFSYPVDDLAPPVVKQTQPHHYSHGDDGSVTYTETENLELGGTLHFRLVGLWMPLGFLSAPSPPLRSDGRVPPVLR